MKVSWMRGRHLSLERATKHHPPRNRYSRAIAEGLLQRVRAGRTLFYGADDLLASEGFSLEDDGFLEIALSETRLHDDRAEAAASVLGPQAVTCMIETVLEAKKRLRDASGKYDQVAGDRAALVLAGQWTTANEPSDGKRFWGGVDFSRVEEKRAARVSDPAATSTEAEAIFSAIEPLIADEATEDQKKRAVALGVVAAPLPHGERDATIQKLISLASRGSRAALLQNLLLSGVFSAHSEIRGIQTPTSSDDDDDGD